MSFHSIDFRCQIILIDIDGTLITSDYQITKETKSVINRIHKDYQIPVVLTTARPFRGMKFIYQELDLVSPVICYNGAQLIDYNEELLINKEIHKTSVENLLTKFTEHNLTINIYQGNDWYVSRIDQLVKSEQEVVRFKATEMDLENLMRGEIDRGFNKILLMGDPENIDHVENILVKDYSKDLNACKSKPHYLEILSSNTSKLTTLKLLLDQMQIKNDSALAIGDNFNDMDMLRYVGLGIAMGNAPPKVKSSADVITSSNDDDGVRKALENYVIESFISE